jgi:PAS domain S-box-containing protein
MLNLAPRKPADQGTAASFTNDKWMLGLLYANTREYFLLVDTDLKIQMFNQVTRRQIKALLDIEITRGTSVLALAPPERHKDLSDRYNLVLQGIPQESEATFTTPNGDIIYIHNSYCPARNEAGEVIAVMVSAKDITEKHKQELVLQDAEERWRFALEGSNLGLWDWDLQTGEMYFSPSYKKLYGFGENEMKNKSEEWTSRIHPEDLQRVTEAVKLHKAGSDPYYEITYRIKDKEERYRWVLSKGMLFSWDDEGHPLRMIGTHTDITEQKRAEEALQQSNERFQLAAKATSEALWEWDIENNRVYNSPVFKDLFGFDVDPTANYDKWVNLIHPEDREETTNSYYNAVEDPVSDRWEKEYRYLTADGGYLYVNDRCVILRNAHGKAIKVVGALRDITQRKEAEREAQENSERFKYASKATSDAIYDWNIVTNNLYWGEGLLKLFGYQSKEIDMKVWESLLHPDDRKLVIESLNVTLQNFKKKYWKQEYRLHRKDGEYSYVLERGFIVRNKEGIAIRMIGALQDISDLKKKEQQLLESNTRFDIVIKATNDLIWDWNLETGEFYRDKEGIRKVYGVKDEKEIETINDWLQRVHPDDHGALQETINAILNTSDQHVFEAEYRFQKDDGEYVYIYDRGLLVRNDAGKPVRLIGAAQNITERKILEEQLIAKELSKQKLISQSTIETQERERGEIGKELHDNVNQILTTTKLYLELTATSPELSDELIQKSTKNIIYVINEIRQLSRSLINPSLGDLGLTDSINDLIENLNLTKKLRITFKPGKKIDVLLSEAQKLMIYRIIQEALNNAVKHAKAKNVTVSLQQKGPNVYLYISDDGNGFNTETIKKGAGLKNIQNRVYLADGTLDIQSEPGSGCTLTIHFPIKPNSD